MKSPFLALVLLLSSTAGAWKFYEKISDLPPDIDRDPVGLRPKIRRCGDIESSRESEDDCVLCSICLPYEYELITCTRGIDSVCSSCSSGYLGITPKTPDFFIKCKSHSGLPFLFPDYVYNPNQHSSMFAEQEQALMNAESKLDDEAEMIEENEEDDEDYEDEEADEEGTEVTAVEVDERDTSESMEEEEDPESIAEDEEDMKKEIEQMVSSKLDEKNTEESFEAEEESDPFDVMEVKKLPDEISIIDSQEIYPIHRSAIWAVIGPKMSKEDSGEIGTEAQKEIKARKAAWLELKRLEKLSVLREKIPVEIIDIYQLPKKRIVSGYRPLPIAEHGSSVSSVPIFHGSRLIAIYVFFACIAVFCLVVLYHSFCLLLHVTRRREMTLPELDETNRQLIYDAYARIHGKYEKKVKPEFV